MMGSTLTSSPAPGALWSGAACGGEGALGAAGPCAEEQPPAITTAASDSATLLANIVFLIMRAFSFGLMTLILLATKVCHIGATTGSGADMTTRTHWRDDLGQDAGEDRS